MTSGKPHYENVPFEIPENWTWCKVEDIFDLNPKNAVSDDIMAGFIPMEAVSAGIGYSHTYTPKRWGDIKKGFSHFRNGDIGIAKISPCFENRKSTIFYDLPNDIGAGTTELTVLRGHCINTELYLYLFQSEWYIKEGTKYFKGVVGQQRVNKEIFTTLLIPLPPVAEQNRIVVEIKKWLKIIDVIDANKQDLQEAIKQTKSKILSLAVSGRLTPQNSCEEPAIELLKRIKQDFVPCDTSHYENIPQNWCVCKLKDIFEITMGSSPSGDSLNRLKDGIEFHQGKICFTDKYLAKSEIFTNSITKLGGKHSILLCVRAPVGLVNITERDICIGRGLCALYPKQGVDLMYAFYAMQTYQDYFEGKATGSTFKAIGGDTIREAEFLLPPYNEQIRIRKALENIFANLDVICSEL